MAQVLNNVVSSNFGDRLKAWWNGDASPAEKAEAQKLAEAKAAARKEVVEDFPAPSGVAEWTAQRISAIQRLYGEGMDGPACVQRVRHLINPIGLNEEMTVLNVGARLGAACRIIAKETGAWVDGIEWNDELVEEAQRLSAKAGLTKKAVIKNIELEDKEVRDHKRDAILIRQALHRVGDRDRVFKTLSELLKPSSHLLINEFLVKHDKGKDERQEWAALHPEAPRLFTLDEIRDGLTQVGFDVRVAKDETKVYKAMLLNDIRSFGESIPEYPVPRPLQEWVMWEVEYWARTFAALDAGGITLHRIHAVSPIDDPTRS